MTKLIEMDDMIELVEEYIFIRKGKRVRIKVPDTNLELQKLGYAYDYAINWFSKNGYITLI